MTTYLIQNIETFETITTFASEAAFDAWMAESTTYGIVSLDTDADGEYDFVALVAPIDGPDYDAVTSEPIADETPQPKKSSKPRKSRKSKGAKMPKSTKSTTTITAKNHDLLAAFITNNPGVTREVVFNDPGLRSALLDAAVIKKIDAGDKLETKRWNSRINRFLRKIKRDGVDLQIVGMGKTATYTIGTPSGQLELPFDDAAIARNAAITGDDTDVVIERPAVDPKRAEEEANQQLSFEALLATLDDEEATITADDQVAFDEAQKMLK